MAVVLASIALAIAIVLIFVVWVRMQRTREDLLADYRNQVKQAEDTFALQLMQLTVSREDYDEAVNSYRTMRDRAQAHFLTADSDADIADRRLSELERFTKRTLEHHTTTGAKPLILRGGLYVQQLPVLNIVLHLVDKFLVVIGADVMYRQDDGPDGSTFYIRWPEGKTPRDLLDDLARRAHCSGSDDDSNTGDNNSASDDSSSSASKPLPGVTELRAVLAALADGGLGVLHLGPLILLRTDTCIQAGFLQPGFHRLTERQKRNAVNGTSPNLMKDLDVAIFLEFRQ